MTKVLYRDRDFSVGTYFIKWLKKRRKKKTSEIWGVIMVLIIFTFIVIVTS